MTFQLSRGDDAGLVADPADVAVFEEAGVGEYQGVGLIGAELFDDVGEIVDVAGAACAVEPELGEFAVVQGEFVEFGSVILVVFGGVGVAGFVAIPRREIDAELQAVLSSGGGDLGDDVAFAVFPWAVFTL